MPRCPANDFEHQCIREDGHYGECEFDYRSVPLGEPVVKAAYRRERDRIASDNASPLDSECGSCGEEVDDACPKSQRPCGHHCNHIWTHDHCHWCGWEVPEDE